MVRFALLTVITVISTGCINPNLEVCHNWACPPALHCVVAAGSGQCVTTDQTLSCSGLDDGTVCPDGACIDHVCLPTMCGNGRVEPGEQCDDGNTIASDGCSPACQREECGNGITDPNEQCDCGAPGVTPRPECQGYNNSTADASAPCRDDCTQRRCGDGILDPPEQCEGAQLGSLSCATFGFYIGALSCTPFCTVSTSGCIGRCGDGQLFGGIEQCDGTNLGGLSCASFYPSFNGALTCTSGCNFDIYTCHGCGDFVCEPELGETCANCPIDCQIGSSCCGDGVCDLATEPKERVLGHCNCAADCGGLCP